MPCWPDLWEHLKGFLLLLGMLAYIALVVILLWAPRLRTRWQRIASRILGAAGAVPLVIVLPAVFFAFALSAGDPPAQTRIVQSQDGQQAKLSYQAGFLGRDHTEVTLKRPGCCRKTVFWHAGPSFFDDPKVEWLNNRHLRITYRTRPGDLQHCERQVGDTAVLCVSQPWPDTPSTNQSSSPVQTKFQ